MSPTPPQDSEDRPSNRLENESSAYLRQHRHNPVDWYPWGEAAFERARSEDKPLLISIGYSACHWCHVMERESFENPEIAALMNELFVSIKVDREERPDVDQIYMDTAMRLTGHGGWPLTVFCMPDGSPFYAGTYFPPEDRANLPGFPTVLRAIDDAYRNRNDEVRRNSAEILEALRDRPQGVAGGLPGAEVVARAAEEVFAGADTQNGGFGGGPKFPTPGNLELLLAATDFAEPDRASSFMQHCLLSCQEMSRRGLYDHLGGAFHRYCVDGSWTIPHFEKMLYDQGLLLRVYAEAWRRAGASHSDLEWPIQETAEYLRRELGPPEAGFAASQDADSEGVEGKFYVWTPSQLREVLGDDAEAVAAAYSVTERGNFEHGTTHLVDRERAPRDRFRIEREKLLAVRAARVAPDTDPKRVAAWNGFTISGLARAGSLLGDPQLCDDATRAADFVLEHMRLPGGGLARIHAEGRASVPAFLDDHAAMLDACLDLYRAGCGERFLTAAFEFGDAIAARFFEPAERDLFLTPGDGEKLVHRPRSDHDGATPHATGLAVLGLERLAVLGERGDLREVVDAVMRTHAFQLERAPQAFPTLVRAVAIRARGLSVAVVVGAPEEASTEALAARARRVLLPEDAVVVAAPGAPPPPGIAPSWLEGRDAQDGQATAYVCRGETCSLPVVDPAQLRPLAGL